ncbi:MAG: hypothetical protein JWO57_6 [Pseudonocardiales bacterium]|nr:hypothetical protein [Pseudonocardiales bacterium]
MIDIVDALDLLERCVQDRRAGHRSGNGIVALALTKGGMPLTEVSRLADTPIGDAYAAGRRPLNLTLGAVVVLRAADSVERRGQPWGLALQAALRAASRYAELIPDGVARRATEAAPARCQAAALSRPASCRPLRAASR